MSAAIVIVSWQGAAVLPACLEALSAQPTSEARLLVVDNHSTDSSVDCVRRYSPGAQVLENETNLGFGGGVNVGFNLLLESGAPDYLILLNQDTVVAPGWQAAILEPFADENVGAVGCKLLYPDGKTVQHAGAYLEYPRALAQHIGWYEPDKGQYDVTRDVHYVTGAALALRMSALRQVGLFDEGYNPGYYEDSDLCWRLRHASYRIVYTGMASALHQESTSIQDIVRRSRLYNRNRLRFVLKTYSSTSFWQDFVPAERRFIAQHGVDDEARALRWAYLHALIALPSTLAARRPLHSDDALDQVKVGQLLVSLRRTVSDCARARLSQIA